MTQTDLAKRAGIGRNLLSRIENGEPSCEIGVVFEVAFLLGIPLFSESDSDRSRLQANLLKQDSLLPERQRKTKVVINDDF